MDGQGRYVLLFSPDGWQVVSNGDGKPELCASPGGRFDDDAGAWLHVWKLARHAQDPLACQALRLVRHGNPGELAHIRTYCLNREAIVGVVSFFVTSAWAVTAGLYLMSAPDLVSATAGLVAAALTLAGPAIGAAVQGRARGS
jgi:hypothetical protein